MKKTKSLLTKGLFIIVWFWISMISQAQVDTNFYEFKNYFFEDYDGTVDTNESGPINTFLKFEYIYSPKFSPLGSVSNAARALDSWISDYEENGRDNSLPESNWSSLGPHKTPSNSNWTSGVGRLSCIEFDPNYPSSIIYCGSPFGGVWKTTNGGSSWTNLNTDFLPVIKISDIAVNPDNTSMIFIATGDRDDYKNASISAGVYRTSNGGQTWQQVNSGINFSGFFQIGKILINPDDPDVIFLATSDGIYKTTDGTSDCEWTLLTHPLVYQKYFRNIIFKPDDLYSTIYASGRDIIKTTDEGTNWSSLTGPGTGIDFSSAPFTGLYPKRINIDVTPASEGIIYATAIFSDVEGQIQWNSLKKHFIFKYENNYWTIFTPLPPNGSPNFQQALHGIGPAMMSIAVSPIDEDLIYFGNVIAWRSTDGGDNFETVFNYDGGQVHPDTRCLKFSPSGDTLYFGTDGGFYALNNPDYTSNPDWDSYNNGLTIGTTQKIGCSEEDDDLALIGNFDCASAIYNPNEYPAGQPWRHIGTGDGCEQLIDYINNDTMYSASQGNTIYKCFNKGIGPWYSIGKPTDPGCSTTQGNENSEFVGDYLIHPREHNVLYVNFSDLYKYSFPYINIVIKDQVSYFDDDFGLNCYDPLIATGIAPNNPNYIYTAVENLHIPDPSDFKLYMTTSGGYDNGCDEDCWTELYPPNPHYITGIAVSPYDENKIWICYSGYDEDDKVKFYNGSSWSDLSDGLPNLPVNSIIYRYGSNDGLFVGTDRGVYYKDASMSTWQPFMSNLPNVMVTDIEISYTNNTIKAGTYGRGLWESPLPCNSTNDTINITSDQDWNVPMRFEGIVIVKSGQTLTINSTAKIYFSEDSKIIVERGGHLIIDGGFLSGSCDEMWLGIEVWGTSSASQNATDQGWVQIKNEGTIENALIGINAVKIESTGGVNYNYTGGMVQCNDAVFNNCQVGIYFQKYPASPYTYSSLSGLSGCSFNTTDDYIGATDPTYFIKMYEINGIDIVNCSFINSSSEDFLGKGILSYHCDVNISGECTSAGSPCTSWDYGTFENLYYGIYALDVTSSRNIEIDRTNFDKNFRGVYISGITDPVVTNNNFEINSEYSSSGGYGLYLNSSTSYEVEENNFYHDDDQTATGVGIIVNNSGTYANEIYRNWFTGLALGISAQQQNRAATGPVGLQLLCNQFDDTHADILVPFTLSLSYGIASNQGAYPDPPSSEDMAGNVFYYNATENDYDDLNNSGHTFNYYYANSAGNYNVQPQDYTTQTINAQGINVNTWYFDNDCPSNQTTGGGGGGRESLLSSLSSTNTQLAETESTLQALVDGGDTESLNYEVTSSTPPEAVDIYTQLLEESPYLSNAVVSSSIDKEDVLPNAMVRDIMIGNPQTAKADELLDQLDNRITPMPEYMKAQILEGRNTIGTKEKLESQIAGYKLNKTKTINALVRDYLGASSSWDEASDSILNLFQQDNEMQSKYRLAMLHLERGEYTSGENVLDNIPSQFELNEAEQEAHQNWETLYDLLASIESSGVNLNALSSGQIQSLYSVYQNDDGIASAWARDILLSLGEINYEEPILMADLQKSKKLAEEFNSVMKSEPPSRINVYPNPSKGYLIVEYDLDGKQNGTIEINDMKGQIMRNTVVNRDHDQITMVIKDWKPGTYIVSLKINGKSIESCKFTLVN